MKSKTITLTLVIPAYNEERYLGACLDSVAKQTLMPNEVIVVDNNSTDNTVKIAKSYKFVKLLHEKNQGIVFARDKGFNAAKSDLIGRIDSDTILEENWVEKAAEYFNKNLNISAVTGTTKFYDYKLSNHSYKIHEFIYFWIQEKIVSSRILWGSNMVIRRSAWLDARTYCNKSNEVHEDIDLIELNKVIDRIKTVKASASLRRENFSYTSTRQYLKLWPKTYFKRQLYIKGLLIYILALLVLLGGLPLFLWHFLSHKSVA